MNLEVQSRTLDFATQRLLRNALYNAQLTHYATLRLGMGSVQDGQELAEQLKATRRHKHLRMNSHVSTVEGCSMNSPEVLGSGEDGNAIFRTGVERKSPTNLTTELTVKP